MGRVWSEGEICHLKHAGMFDFDLAHTVFFSFFPPRSQSVTHFTSITYSDIFRSTQLSNFQINSTTLYQLDLIFVIVLKCKISLSHTHKHINTHTLSCVIWIPLCLKYLHKYTEIFVFNEKNWPLPSQKCNITSSHLSLPRTEMTLHALPSAKICFQVHTDSSEQEEQRSGSWKLSHFMVSNIW